jgi:hypothetical protein
MRGGARSGNQERQQYTEEELREMDDASIMAMVMHESVAGCSSTEPAPPAVSLPLSSCDSHDGPPIVVEVD